MIKAIAHVAFSVTDMERSVDFYCNKLGFKDAFEMKKDGKPIIRYIKVSKNQFIELFYGNGDFGNKHSYSHLCLEVDDIDMIANHLKQIGIALTSPVKQGMDTNYQCWAQDPDGNKIEFMQISKTSPQYKASHES